jgi:NAD-dependent DNA ligase
LTEPAPEIGFQGKAFCFTGKFQSGTRQECQDKTLELDGIVDPRPTLKTDYLVVGTGVSPDWVHTSYGTKIKKVIQQVSTGKATTSIVSEELWIAAVNAAAL